MTTAVAERINYSNLITGAATTVRQIIAGNPVRGDERAQLTKLGELLRDGLPAEETDPGNFVLQGIVGTAWMAQSGPSTIMSWFGEFRAVGANLVALGARSRSAGISRQGLLVHLEHLNRAAHSSL